MTKPKFITVCQQAKKLLDMMPVVDEDIKYYIVNYREASEFFFAEGMYWELYDFDKKYPEATFASNSLRKIIEVYDSLPKDVYEIMKVDPFRPAVIFFCGRKAERAILDHQDVAESMKDYQSKYMMDMFSKLPKSNEPEDTPPLSEDLPF